MAPRHDHFDKRRGSQIKSPEYLKRRTGRGGGALSPTANKSVGSNEKVAGPPIETVIPSNRWEKHTDKLWEDFLTEGFLEGIEENIEARIVAVTQSGDQEVSRKLKGIRAEVRTLIAKRKDIEKKITPQNKETIESVSVEQNRPRLLGLLENLRLRILYLNNPDTYDEKFVAYNHTPSDIVEKIIKETKNYKTFQSFLSANANLKKEHDNLAPPSKALISSTMVDRLLDPKDTLRLNGRELTPNDCDVIFSQIAGENNTTPETLSKIANYPYASGRTLLKIAKNPKTSPETLLKIAKNANASGRTLLEIAKNPNASSPRILEIILNHEKCDKETADAITNRLVKHEKEYEPSVVESLAILIGQVLTALGFPPEKDKSEEEFDRQVEVLGKIFAETSHILDENAAKDLRPEREFSEKPTNVFGDAMAKEAQRIYNQENPFDQSPRTNADLETEERAATEAAEAAEAEYAATEAARAAETLEARKIAALEARKIAALAKAKRIKEKRTAAFERRILDPALKITKVPEMEIGELWGKFNPGIVSKTASVPVTEDHKSSMEPKATKQYGRYSRKAPKAPKAVMPNAGDVAYMPMESQQDENRSFRKMIARTLSKQKQMYQLIKQQTADAIDRMKHSQEEILDKIEDMQQSSDLHSRTLILQRQKIDAMQKQLDAMQQQHEAEMKEQNERHALEMQERYTLYLQPMKEIQQQHAQEMLQMQNQMQQQSETHARTMEEQHKQHLEEMQKLLLVQKNDETQMAGMKHAQEHQMLTITQQAEQMGRMQEQVDKLALFMPLLPLIPLIGNLQQIPDARRLNSLLHQFPTMQGQIAGLQAAQPVQPALLVQAAPAPQVQSPQDTRTMQEIANQEISKRSSGKKYE